MATTQNSMFLASPEYMPVAGMPVTPRSSSSITSAASSSGFSVMIKAAFENFRPSIMPSEILEVR